MADTEDDNATMRESEVTRVVSAVHVVGALSHSVSTDGTTAMLVLEVADEDEESGKRKFALTLPVKQVAWFRDLSADLHRHALNRGLDAGSFVVHQGIDWSVGADARFPKLTTLVFNINAADAYAVSFHNVEMYRFGAALQREVGPKLSASERQDAQLLPQLLKPNNSLIRP